MDDLTPVTRTERLLDGEDLTPTNREEMFIKRIYDKTQEIPEPVNRKEYFLKKAGEAGGDVTVVPLSVTENGTYSEEGKAYSPVTVEVAPPEDSYQLKSITTPTSLATFEASAMPMPKLKVSVEAKQDLHGYDHPWVGGAGKNILPMGIINEEVNDIIFTKISDIDGNALGFSMVGLCSSTTSRIIASIPVKAGTYILNGCNGGAYNTYALRIRDENDTSNAVWQEDGDAQIAFASDTTALVQVFVWQNTNVNQTIYPMLRKSGTSADFEPYSNICPISGWSEVKVSDVDDVENPTVTQTTTISIGQTVYGGELDVVNGVLKITDGYIASYNGETLPSTWISSMDVYAEGTTPTIGAEVCYERANPISTNLTPTLIKSLNGQNNLSVDCGGVIEGEYFKALGGE